MNTSDCFGQWMDEVDKAVYQLAMVSVYELSDQCFRDWFGSGMEPEEAAEKALNSDGFCGWDE